MVASIKAATPEGTDCSAQASRPWHPRNSSVPTATAARHCPGAGRSPSRRRAHAKSTVPAISDRAAIMRNGGMTSAA